MSESQGEAQLETEKQELIGQAFAETEIRLLNNKNLALE